METIARPIFSAILNFHDCQQFFFFIKDEKIGFGIHFEFSSITFISLQLKTIEKIYRNQLEKT
jgi:hypothetical protein